MLIEIILFLKLHSTNIRRSLRFIRNRRKSNKKKKIKRKKKEEDKKKEKEKEKDEDKEIKNPLINTEIT